MKIDSFKELKKLIDLCHKSGVEAIEIDGIKMNLRPIAAPTRKRRKAVEVNQTTDGTEDLSDVIDMPDELTPEQMLMWSVTAPNETTGEQ